MKFSEKIRLNSVFYFVLSIVFRWFYNLSIWVFHGFTGNQKVILHLLLAVASSLFAWMALRLYKRSSPTGSNLGCFFVLLLYVNVVASFGAIFFAMVQFFSQEGGGPETIWLL